MKSKLVNILYSLCLCLQWNQVLGSSHGTSGQRFSQYGNGGGSLGDVHYSGSHSAYETTITTEMNYVPSASKKDKKGNHHAEYEFIGGGGYVPQGGALPKGTKKQDYYTHEPTDYGDSVAPSTQHRPPKGSKSNKGCYYDEDSTYAPTQTHSYAPTHTGKGKASKKGPPPPKKGCKSIKSSKKGSHFPSAVPCK